MALKVSELRNLTKDELTAKLTTLKSSLFNMRYQAEVERIEKPHKIQDIKKEIARIVTILREGETKNGSKPK